jgi:oligoendopeptidase F
MAQKILARSEVPVEQTWDIHSVFPSDSAWEEEIKRVTDSLPQVASFRGRLGESPKVLADWFDLVERVGRSLGKIVVYAGMQHHVDTTDQAAAAKNDRARGLFARVMATMAFAEPEMLSIGFEKLRRWTKEEPRLAIYGHYFDELERRKEHIRSAEVEELLRQVMDPFRTAAATHGILSDAELTFKPAAGGHEITHSTISTLLHHPDREVRRTAWENYCDAFLAFKNTMANCIAAGVKQNVFMARAQKI